MVKHIQRNHPPQYATLQKELQASQSGVSVKRAKVNVLSGVKMSVPALELHCLRLVSEHGYPFKMLDSDAFQAIISPMIAAMPAKDRVIINGRSVPDKIHAYADEVRQAITAEVKGKLVSIKADLGSRNHRSFWGVNVQFISNGQLVIRTLAVVELVKAHTALHMKTEISLLLQKYEIPLQNVISLTTDNGANIILACKLLGEAAKAEFEDAEDDVFVDDEEEITVPHIPELELREADFTIQSVRCAAHTLQLAVEDGIKKCGGLRGIFDAVRKLAKYLRTPRLSSVLTRDYALPTLDCKTRWGSKYDMLESILKIRDFPLTEKEQEDYGLSEDEWKQVEELTRDLEPPRAATKELQKADLLLGDFYSCWLRCKLKLEGIASTLALEVAKAMGERAKAQSYIRGEQRFSPLFHYPSFNAAVFLDPRFFGLLSPEQVEDAKSFILHIHARVKKQPLEQVIDSDYDDNLADLEEEEDDADELSALLVEGNRARVNHEGTTNLHAVAETYYRTTKRMPRKANILQYWEKQRLIMPELYAVANAVLSIPATEVSVERLFSALKYILNPLRFCLRPGHIDDILLLNTNKDLLKNTVLPATLKAITAESLSSSSMDDNNSST